MKTLKLVIVSFFSLAFLMAGEISGKSVAKLDEPEIKFETAELILGHKHLKVELAQTQDQLSRGLMYRQRLAEGTGMLFIFPKEEIRSFWMKNTFVPLSIGFFDSHQRLIDIQDMEPVKSVMEAPQSYISRGSARYALEVPRGWFQKNKIKLRDAFKLKK